MKAIILILTMLCTLQSYAQSEPEVVEITEVDEYSKEVPFQIIEDVPIYKGCNPKFKSSELKKCMADHITELFLKKFNIKVAKGLGLPNGLVRINATFKIDTKGDLVEIMISAAHQDLEKETQRVINKIPRFTRPGHFRGKPVVVPYSLPIVFKIDNSK